MFTAIARAVFGTANDRSLKGYQRRVPQISALEPAMIVVLGFIIGFIVISLFLPLIKLLEGLSK